MSSESAIDVKNITKTFHESNGSGSFKEAFVNIGRKFTSKKEKIIYKGEFTALNNINFEIKKGEFFGIVGRNGSGKSTLLKILAGVYTPTTGSVTVNGKLTPFIELGVGFNPELSGRDNVFLNGALLGFTRKQMESMYDDIVEFAELKEFMDTKLKNYSSGMQVRLAFSVAIRAESDILLIDEVLAVGDAAFQQKCFDYFEEIKDRNRTVVFVSHDMNAVRRFCSKAIYIENSRITSAGSASKIADIYIEKNISKEEKRIDKNKISMNDKNTLKISILEDNDESVQLRFDIKSVYNPKDIYIGLSLIYAGISVGEINSRPIQINGKSILYKLSKETLNPGKYEIGAALFKKKNKELIAVSKKRVSFIIKGYDDTRGSALRLKARWEN